MKDQIETFQDKVNNYLLRELNNPREILIVFQDLKDSYAQVDMDNPRKLSKVDK